MILSAQLKLSEAQAITSTAISENVIDLGVSEPARYGGKAPLHADLGKGTRVPLLIQVVQDIIGATDVEFQVIASANENMSSPSVLVSQTIPGAELVAGKQTNLNCVPRGADQRYLAVNYVVNGTATSGAVTAGITAGVQDYVNMG